MFAKTYKDLLNFESPILDSFNSLILAYCSLASELEKSGMGHLSIDWYQRAFQAATKFRLDKKVLQELQKLLDLSHAHRTPSQPPTASNSQRINVMSPNRSAPDVVGGWHVKDPNNSKEYHQLAGVQGTNDTTSKARPKSALPRLFQDRVTEEVDSTKDGVFEAKRTENERRRPSNDAKLHHFDGNDFDDLSRPKSAVSKLGERYNNMVNSSSAETERLISKMLTSTSTVALQRVSAPRDALYPSNPSTFSGDLLMNKRAASTISAPNLLSASVPHGHSIILLPTPSKNKVDILSMNGHVSSKRVSANGSSVKNRHVETIPETTQYSTIQNNVSHVAANNELPEVMESISNPLTASALKKSGQLQDSNTVAKISVPLSKANKTALSKTIQSKVFEKVKAQKEGVDSGAAKFADGPSLPESYLHLDEFGRDKIKRVADMYIPYFKGLKVEARYQMNRLGHKGRWYPGRIIRADFAKGMYDIEFENGDREKNIFVDDIRIPEHASKQALMKTNQSIKTLPRKREDDEFEKKVSGAAEEKIPARVLRNKNGEEMHNVVMKLLGGINQRGDLRKIERLQVKGDSIIKLQSLVRGVLCRIRFPKRLQQLKREKVLRSKERELKALEEKLAKNLQNTDPLGSRTLPHSARINEKSMEVVNKPSKSSVTFAEVQTGASLVDEVELEIEDRGIEKEQSFNYMINDGSQNFLGADLNTTYPDERIQYPVGEDGQQGYVFPTGPNIAYYQAVNGDPQHLYAPLVNNYVLPTPNLEYVQEILAATVQEQQRGWKEMEQERANYFAQEVNELREAFLAQRSELDRLKREEERKRQQLEKQIKDLLHKQEQQHQQQRQYHDDFKVPPDIHRSKETVDSPAESLGHVTQHQPPKSLEQQNHPPVHKPQERDLPNKFSPESDKANQPSKSVQQAPIIGSDPENAGSSIDCGFLTEEEAPKQDIEVNIVSDGVDLSLHFESSQEQQETAPVSGANSLGQDVRIEDFWNSLSLGDFPMSERPGTVASPVRLDPQRIDVIHSPLPMNPEFFGSAILGESLVERTSIELGPEYAAVIDGSLSMADEDLNNLASQVDTIERDMNSRHDMAYKAMTSVADNDVDVDLDSANLLELESSLTSKKYAEDSMKRKLEETSTMHDSDVIGFSGEVPPPHIERYMSFHGLGDISVSNNGGSSEGNLDALDNVISGSSLDKLSQSELFDIKQQILATSFDSQQHQFALEVVNAFISQAALKFSPVPKMSQNFNEKLDRIEQVEGSRSIHSHEDIEETKEIAQVVAEEVITSVGSKFSTESIDDANNGGQRSNFNLVSPLDVTQQSVGTKLSTGDDPNDELSREERDDMIIEWLENLWNALLNWTFQQILMYTSLTTATEKSILAIRASSTKLPATEPLQQEFSMMLKDLAFEVDDDVEGEESELPNGNGSKKGNMSPQSLRINSFLSEKVKSGENKEVSNKWIDKYMEYLQSGRNLFEEANKAVDDILLLGRDELDEGESTTKLLFEDMISTLQELANNVYQFYVSNILVGTLPSKDVMIEHKPSDVNPYLVSALHSNWNSKWWIDIDRRLISFFTCFKSDITVHHTEIRSRVKDKFYAGLRNVLKRCENQTWQPYWQARENCQLLIGKDNLCRVIAKAESIMYIIPITSPSRHGKGTLVTPAKYTTKSTFDASGLFELVKKVADPKM